MSRQEEVDEAPKCEPCKGLGIIPGFSATWRDRDGRYVFGHSDPDRICSACQGTGFAGGREP